MSYSLDMRACGLELVSRGKKKAEVARMLGVHRQSIQRWVSQAAQGQKTAGRPGPKRNRKVPEAALSQAVREWPDARLIELSHQFGVHPSTISKALKRLRISRKKNVALPRGTGLRKKAAAFSQALV
jgi:putative transposase